MAAPSSPFSLPHFRRLSHLSHSQRRTSVLLFFVLFVLVTTVLVTAVKAITVLRSCLTIALRGGVWQLQKLIVSFSDWGGSSRGISPLCLARLSHHWVLPRWSSLIQGNLWLLPDKFSEGSKVFLVDPPVLATGGAIVAALNLLKERGLSN